MTAAMAMPDNTAETFLVHFFGTGLADDRYAASTAAASPTAFLFPYQRHPGASAGSACQAARP